MIASSIGKTLARVPRPFFLGALGPSRAHCQTEQPLKRHIVNSSETLLKNQQDASIDGAPREQPRQ